MWSGVPVRLRRKILFSSKKKKDNKWPTRGRTTHTTHTAPQPSATVKNNPKIQPPKTSPHARAHSHRPCHRRRGLSPEHWDERGTVRADPFATLGHVSAAWKILFGINMHNAASASQPYRLHYPTLFSAMAGFARHGRDGSFCEHDSALRIAPTAAPSKRMSSVWRPPPPAHRHSWVA